MREGGGNRSLKTVRLMSKRVRKRTVKAKREK